MLSGLKTRSLGPNTLGTTLSPASSQSVQVGRPTTASWVQPVLSKVNVTCSRPQRNVRRPGIEPGTPWPEIPHPNHCTTPPPTEGNPETLKKKRSWEGYQLPLPCHMQIEGFLPVHSGEMRMFDTAD